MRESTTPRRRLHGVHFAGAVVAVGAILRFWRLGQPPLTIWDEKYYAFDAYSYLLGTPDLTAPGAPRVKILFERTWEHPPLGKELIGLGMGPLDFSQWGSRIAPAVFGTLCVALAVLVVARLYRSWVWAGLAGGLVAFDGIEIVHSRAAMLDIFLTTFVLAGLLAALMAREEPSRLLWPVACGAMIGGAIACKWTGLFMLAPLTLLSAQHQARRATGAIARCALVGTSAAVIYLASYGIFFADNGFAGRDFIHLQARMFEKQHGNQRKSPDRSSAASWPLLRKPIRYYYEPAAGPVRREVLALGNPALWWGFLILLPLQGWALFKRRRWQDAVGISGYLCLWAPWLLFGRTKYIYYMVPVVPFMALSCVSAIRGLPDPWAKRVGLAFGVTCTVVALAFMPMWIDLPLPGYTHYLRWLPTWI